MKLIIIPIILAVCILSFQINKPFVGHHDFMSAFMGKIAKNYVEYGRLNLKFGQATGFIINGVENHHSFQLSYLPLVPLLISFSYQLFGITEWSTRIIPAVASVVGLIYFFLIIKKIWGEWPALIASLFYLLTPMFMYFGKLPAPEPLIIASGLTAFYYYQQWRDNQPTKFVFLILSLGIGALAGWPIVYFAAAMFLHSVLTKQINKKIILLMIFVIMMVLLQLVHAYILTGSFLPESLMSTFRLRFSQQEFSFGGVEFNLLTYLKQELSWAQAYFTRVLLILSVLGGISLLFKNSREKTATILAFVFFGIAHLLLFSRYVFVHDFLNIYLLPVIALLAMLGLFFLYHQLSKLPRSNSYIYLILGAVMIFFCIERADFTKALIKTDMNMPAKQMADTINSLQNKGGEVTLVSPRFVSFYGVFMSYYSNDYYVSASEEDLKQEKNLQKFKYIILLDEDIVDKVFYESLITKYRSNRKNDITTIYTNEPI